ncbi:MAG: hypothetical protein DYG98_20895 [Haliscomenobacteraceae bacterium CHB4]|nr:hypothetical protein [Haliscomenobacteraceae bacterium CHB4]
MGVQAGQTGVPLPEIQTRILTTVFSYLLLYQGIRDALWFLKRFGVQEGGAGKRTGSNNIPRILFYALLVAVLTAGGWWYYYLLFWIVPYLSAFFMFQYIRSVAEHFGDLGYDHLLTSTRSVRPTLVERFFLAPHQVGYHLEHHLYPGVPFYHLPSLHRLLMADPGYGARAHITEGYVSGLLNELGAGFVKPAQTGATPA